MGEVVSLVAKELVDNPEKVQINTIDKGKLTIVELKVAPEDMGKIIGKNGKIIKMIRNIAKIEAIKKNKKVKVEIVE